MNSLLTTLPSHIAQDIQATGSIQIQACELENGSWHHGHQETNQLTYTDVTIRARERIRRMTPSDCWAPRCWKMTAVYVNMITWKVTLPGIRALGHIDHSGVQGWIQGSRLIV